jgi:hypothetical protein
LGEPEPARHVLFDSNLKNKIFFSQNQEDDTFFVILCLFVLENPTPLRGSHNFASARGRKKFAIDFA